MYTAHRGGGAWGEGDIKVRWRGGPTTLRNLRDVVASSRAKSAARRAQGVGAPIRPSSPPTGTLGGLFEALANAGQN